MYSELVNEIRQQYKCCRYKSFCGLAILKLSVISLLIIGASTGCDAYNRDKPIKAITIDVTGDAFHWYFSYPGEDGVMGNEDDRRSTGMLYLPNNADVTLNLNSKDYLYSFALPKFAQNGIAVPELNYTLTFTTGAPGIFKLRGDQFCGFSHDTLMGEVRVRNQKDGFYGWELSTPDTVLDAALFRPTKL